MRLGSCRDELGCKITAGRMQHHKHMAKMVTSGMMANPSELLHEVDAPAANIHASIIFPFITIPNGCHITFLGLIIVAACFSQRSRLAGQYQTDRPCRKYSGPRPWDRQLINVPAAYRKYSAASSVVILPVKTLCSWSKDLRAGYLHGVGILAANKVSI